MFIRCFLKIKFADIRLISLEHITNSSTSCNNIPYNTHTSNSWITNYLIKSIKQYSSVCLFVCLFVCLSVYPPHLWISYRRCSCKYGAGIVHLGVVCKLRFYLIHPGFWRLQFWRLQILNGAYLHQLHGIVVSVTGHSPNMTPTIELWSRKAQDMRQPTVSLSRAVHWMFILLWNTNVTTYQSWRSVSLPR